LELQLAVAWAAEKTWGANHENMVKQGKTWFYDGFIWFYDGFMMGL